ncbi:RNA polymerase sigma-70 factor [Chloroflexi bacterium TSY]|nr:RNA polymerase sigma-70 factor [Chloroflexi bacterium TSY]
MTTKVENFETYRPLLFSIAYRMLGSVMEAEDIVQDTYLRYQATETDQIQSHKAFLSTITTRLCLDYLKSARVQRENYVGPWLPEPLLTQDQGADSSSLSSTPAQVVLQKEMVSMAFLALLDKLSPTERAVFLLREAFDYSYTEIAPIVNKSEANCRQLYSRAKRYLKANRPVFETSPQVQQQVITQFVEALQNGDTESLTGLMTQDVQWLSDGGGKVVAATRPLVGHERVIQFLFGLLRNAPEDFTPEFIETNGTQSLLLRLNGQIDSIMNFLIRDGQICEVRAVRNPDKLRHIVREFDQ